MAPPASLGSPLTTPRRFLANRYGLGYQMPLGLVFLGGPLLDAGHRVRLLDNDVLGWDDARLARELARDRPDVVMIGHTDDAPGRSMSTFASFAQRVPKTFLAYQIEPTARLDNVAMSTAQ